MSDELTEALARVPFLAGRTFSSRRLAGLTNVNYFVEVADERFVVRIPGQGTSEYIDRAAEGVAARVAADVKVNAEVLLFDESDGLMVTRFVDGSTTMSAEHFRDLGAVGRAGEAFRRLHSSKASFAVDFQLFTMIDEYRSLLATKGTSLPHGYDDAVGRADHARRILERVPAPLVPCHCDPLCENFLDTGTTMFIIDYEYGGNNDPMWDLGDLSVEGEFGPEQDAALLRAYFGGEPPPDQAGRMVVYKALCDLLWTLWGLIQHANDNPADDFETYALNRFRRCQALMSSDAFTRALAAIEQ